MAMPRPRWIACFACLCLSVVSAAAQETQDPHARAVPPQPEPKALAAPPDAAVPDETPTVILDEVVVTGTRTKEALRDVPASVSVVTREEIEEIHATRVEELLVTLPGVDQAAPVAGGAPGAPRLRGLPGTFAGATTQVLVDGMPVEPILISNRQAWLLVDPQDVERLEVVRGPASALYGPSAAGGVINIITRSGRGAPFLVASSGYGSHTTRQFGITAGGTVAEKLDLLVGASDYRTDGYRPWPETPARYAPYYPEGLNDLAGRDSSNRRLLLRVGARPSEQHELSLSYRYFEVDGAWLGGHPNYGWDRHGGMADLAYRWRPSDALELKARLLRSEYANRVRYDSNAYSGDGVLDLIAVDRERETAWNGDLQADLRLLRGNVLTLGGSWQEGELKYRGLDAEGTETESSAGKSRVIAGYLQDQHRFGEWVTLQAGARFDRYRFSDDVRAGTRYPASSDDVFTYRAGLRVNPVRTTSLYASTGSAYLPALNTLKFRRSGGTWLSNPELKPERSVSYEVGATQELGGRVSCTLALFQTLYQDKITVAQVGAQRQYQNLAEVRVKGLEASAEAPLREDLRIFGNYTLSDSVIGKDPSAPETGGKHPAYTPKHKASFGLAYTNPRVVAVRVAGRWVGVQYSSDTNSADSRMSPFFTVDARVAHSFFVGEPRREIALSLGVSNLLDRRYVEWNDELADRRSFWGGLTLRL